MDPDLRQKIEQNYGFLVLGIEPITHSKSGLIYRLDTSQGKRILKGHEPAFNRERLALQHDTIRRLRSAGMLMFPEVYPATEAGGQGPDSLEASTLFTHAGNNFGVYEFKEGEFYSWNDEELQDLAVVLARFHQACAEDRNASRHWKGDPSAQLANLAQLKEYLSPAPETGQSREVKVALDRLRLHLA
ncbi:MAG TPA: phosphotransferase, partial [Candidatus Nanoarchaeia archaeon]|nr:phosphotransferase [Candidatus Nanoarchaeia archaeon]